MQNKRDDYDTSDHVFTNDERWLSHSLWCLHKKIIKEMLTKLSEKTKTQNCAQAGTCVCVHVCIMHSKTEGRWAGRRKHAK